MSVFVSVSDLFRVALPRDCQNGWLAMLSAYFDDTGTHQGGKWGPSKIVAVAGIYGTESELLSLEGMWRELIDAPLCGRKPSLSRFHMYDCQNSIGEFLGWSRTETDFFCHQLGEAIIKSGVSGYGCACSREDWDELVTGEVRAIMGDAEGSCVRNCFVKSCAWAQQNTFDPQMSFVFDKRPGRRRENSVIFDAFQRWVDPPPELVGLGFYTSHKILPLQAADLVAWEFYRHANEVLASGNLQPPSRPQFRKLAARMRFEGQIELREGIGRVVEYTKNHPHVGEIANHFMTFDPASAIE